MVIDQSYLDFIWSKDKTALELFNRTQSRLQFKVNTQGCTFVFTQNLILRQQYLLVIQASVCVVVQPFQRIKHAAFFVPQIRHFLAPKKSDALNSLEPVGRRSSRGGFRVGERDRHSAKSTGLGHIHFLDVMPLVPFAVALLKKFGVTNLVRAHTSPDLVVKYLKSLVTCPRCPGASAIDQRLG